MEISRQADVRLPSPLILILPTRPWIRLVRVGALGAYRWSSRRRQLLGVDISHLKEDGRTYPPLSLDTR